MNRLKRLSGLRVRLYAVAPLLIMALAACHK
jgi:hypothetical protein